MFSPGQLSRAWACIRPSIILYQWTDVKAPEVVLLSKSLTVHSKASMMALGVVGVCMSTVSYILGVGSAGNSQEPFSLSLLGLLVSCKSVSSCNSRVMSGLPYQWWNWVSTWLLDTLQRDSISIAQSQSTLSGLHKLPKKLKLYSTSLWGHTLLSAICQKVGFNIISRWKDQEQILGHWRLLRAVKIKVCATVYWLFCKISPHRFRRALGCTRMYS